MTFYLISLGLKSKDATHESIEIVKNCKEVYLENYTVDFPFEKGELEEIYQKKIKELEREKVELEDFLKKAKKEDIALLVYGDALSATTHSELILSCKKNKIPFKITHNASILTAIAETGLQLYKFGKTASMPTWRDNWKPDSFIEIIKQNKSISAHTLLLVDINLEIEKSKEQLREAFQKNSFQIDRIILCSNLGVNSKIYYLPLEKIPKKIKKPYCIIIPDRLHFHEEEYLEKFK